MRDPEQQRGEDHVPIARIDALRWSGESNDAFAQILFGLASATPEQSAPTPLDTLE